jgi:Zn-dependent peptidase ImmA (M78 family)
MECLAWGLLRAYGVEGPPVPVREMILHSLPIFDRLSILELNLGLYDAAYKFLLDGSRLIAVDLGKPQVVQRASMARELYVAFCHSSRAAELGWPHREQPYPSSDLFARCLLMPAVWVRRACADDVSLEDLAACFGVPVRMAAQRVSETASHKYASARVPLAPFA